MCDVMARQTKYHPAGPAVDMEYTCVSTLEEAGCGPDDSPADNLQRPLFTTAAWFDLIARTALRDKTQPVFLAVGDAGDARACVPLQVGWDGGTRTLEALANFYSPVFEPVSNNPANLEAAADALARFAAASSPSVDVVNLRPLDCASDFYLAAQDRLRAAGFWVDTYFCFGNWVHEVGDRDFEDYFKGRPSRLRNTSRRARRRLETLGLGIAVMKSESPALDTAIVAFEDIYARSWRHRSEPHPRFIRELCLLGARRGWLRLGLLRVGERAVAAQIWFVKDGIASIFKLAHLEDHARLSVGTVLTTEMMRHVIDVDKVHLVDYLSGDDEYKKEWMSVRLERRGIVAFNRRSPRGLMKAARHFASAGLKRLMTPPGRPEFQPLSEVGRPHSPAENALPLPDRAPYPSN